MLLRRLSQRTAGIISPARVRKCSTMASWEEETLSKYVPEQFYSVHIGDVFEKRYETLLKLGYGGNSTIWLCKDMHYQPSADEDDLRHPYRVLKVGTSNSQGHHETNILNLIKEVHSDHVGQYLIRTLYDAFDIDGQNSRFHAIVQNPLGRSLLDYQNQQPNRQLLPVQVKYVLAYLLRALDFLHTEVGVIHTDVKPDNILFTLPEDEGQLLQALHKSEICSPSCSKIVDDNRTIYRSRVLDVEMTFNEFPILTDFSSAVACKSDEVCLGTVSPRQYRAPEVILGMEWNSSIDIWSIEILVSDLILGKQLFPVYNDWDHLALLIAYLGPPPIDYLQRSRESWKYFTKEGKFKGGKIPERSLEVIFKGDDEQAIALEFLKSTLTWKSEHRKSAQELYKHPWMPPPGESE